MNLYPQSMGMDGGEAGKLMMEDMGGTLLESSGGLLLLAKEGRAENDSFSVFP